MRKDAGSDGPKISAITRKTKKLATVVCTMVDRRIVANLTKKMSDVKSMMIAAATVVKAAASIEGPISITAILVRVFRSTLPGSEAYECVK